MIEISSTGSRALLVGGMAAWLTTMSVGKDWLIKDYLFVVAVVAVILIGGLRKAKYERMMQSERLQRAHDLEKIEFIHGDPVQLELNKVTCILFFGTWCKKSREALEVFACLHETVSHRALQFVGLTQETREELAMYEVKGRNATNFRELKQFKFPIGIETGLMSKEYLVRCDLLTVPQLFIVGKNRNITWYGDPSAGIVETKIRAALEQVDAIVADAVEKAKTLPEAPEPEEKQQSNAA
ncbi:Thioredoxin-like fold [Phytophthora cinnamomi]|uniref:Thioredoxin-like fold n=1 Tax=Phytophthora cinnamomi TaxID=4785 RepID=UPI003559C6AE|nr:Thioredoxin-like fold [Phytophthora cinnamomi]